MPPWVFLTRLPWAAILTETAVLLKRANDLRDSRIRPAVTPASNDIEALRQRLAELEKQQHADAEMIQQLATEIATIAAAAETTAATLRQAYLLAIVGIAFGVLATLLAWFR
jgi:septal ring factor EnvC (AmiA/AmiB activator)